MLEKLTHPNGCILRGERLHRYRSTMERGRQRMGGKRAVICGLARDLAHILPATIERIERLGNRFADYRVVVYENDSKDATLSILHRWTRANHRVHVLSESRHDPVSLPVRCLQRARRMAYYRNQCRQFTLDLFPDYDYTIVVDLDIELGWLLDGIANTFGHNDWDFVGSNGILRKSYVFFQRTKQYDAWAYRRQGSYDALETRMVNRMYWRQGEPMHPVYSCFGGLGVYRMEAMAACEYGESDCEHVCLHLSMRQNGFARLFLNPSQIVDHGIRLSRVRLLLANLRQGGSPGLLSLPPKPQERCYSSRRQSDASLS